MADNIQVTRSSMPDFEQYCEEIRKLWDSHWLTNMGEEHKELQKTAGSFFELSSRRSLHQWASCT